MQEAHMSYSLTSQRSYSVYTHIDVQFYKKLFLEPLGVTVSPDCLMSSLQIMSQRDPLSSHCSWDHHPEGRALCETVDWEERLASCQCYSLLTLSLATDGDTSFMSHFIKSNTRCSTAPWGNREPDASQRLRCPQTVKFRDRPGKFNVF